MKKSGFAKGVFWTLSVGIIFVIILAGVGMIAYNGYTNASLEASYSRGGTETKIKIEKKDKLPSEIASVDKKQGTINEVLLKDKTSDFPDYSLNEIFKIAKKTSRWSKDTAIDERQQYDFHCITLDYRKVLRNANCGTQIDAWTFLKMKMVSEITYEYYSKNNELFWEKLISYRKDILKDYLAKQREFQKYVNTRDDCKEKLKYSDGWEYRNYCINSPYNKNKQNLKEENLFPMPKAWAENLTGTYYWSFSSDQSSAQRIARKKCNDLAKLREEDECEILNVNGIGFNTTNTSDIVKKKVNAPEPNKYKFNTSEKYYALVIGNNNYEHLEKLDAAENDAVVIADVLTNKYGFEVNLLLNADYDTTVNSLFKITNELKKNDNLLIYYAGHGQLDKAENRGYWLPVDASFELRSKWISNQIIVDRIKATKAKHVLLIADSCFSGTLMRSGTTPDVNEAIDEKYIERLKSKKTRLVITSGGNEPVVDSDGGNHSLFALKLIDTLKNNNTVINSQILFENIRRYVVSNADQTPERALVHKTGHDGGDFLFFPKE